MHTQSLLKKKTLNKLNQNLLLVYTGIKRTAHDIARGYVNKLNKSKKSHILQISNYAEEAEKAGADFVGASDMIEKVKDGWTGMDVVVAAPDMMPEVGKLGKIHTHREPWTI